MTNPPDPESWHTSFIAKAGGTFGLRIVGLVLQFAGSVFIARLLGVEEFGVYTYAFTCVVITGTLLSLGMGQLAVRELPRFILRGETDLLRGFLSLTFGLTLIIGLVCTGVLFWLQKTGWITSSIGWVWLAAGMLVHALILSLATILRGFQRIVQSQFIETVLRQSVFLVALGLIFLIGRRPDALEVFKLSIFASLPVLAIMIWLGRRSIIALPASPGGTRPRLATRLWLASAIPLLVMAFANQMQTNLDVLMIGAIADPVDVGRYRAASRGADLMLIANSIAIQVLGPMLARAMAGDDTEENRVKGQKLITQSALISALLGGMICLVLGVGAGEYLGLFGAEFLPAVPVLRILLIAQIIGILCGPVAVILITMGHERLVLMISLAALVQNLVLNLALIPTFGMMGAASATFIAVVVYKVTLMIFVLRRCGFDPTLLAVWRRKPSGT